MARMVTTSEGVKWEEEPGDEAKKIKVREMMFSEIFQKVNNVKTKKEKIKILKDNDHPSLRSVIKWSFDPKIETDLPEGNPPYIPNEAPEGVGEHTLIITEAPKFYNFIKGANNHSKMNRERMFVRLLESLHRDEAELMLVIKDKRLHQKYKGFSKEVVKEAFGWDDNFNRIDV
tara:strand:+ start:365 stop:886 length:522 start_codon:yes stop_codon:yes gene_type:complete